MSTAFVEGRLGASGVMAVGLLMFGLAFYFSAVRPAEDALAQLQARVRSAPVPAAPRTPAQRDLNPSAQSLYRNLPALERLPDVLAQVHALAAGAGIDLPRSDYRLQESGDGISAYQVTISVNSTYPQLRQMISDLLQQMPAVSIDSLRFERASAAIQQLETRITLTAYFRRHSTANRIP